MKIAIVTSGRLPVPATKGGAVETKLDYILDYNAEHHLHDITVYSVKPDKPIDKSTKENHYVFIDKDSLSWSLMRKVYRLFNRHPYYDDNIEYFLHRCIKLMKKERYDCIIIANRPGYALKLRKKTTAKLVLQINNDYLNTETRKGSEIKESCQLVITCSDYLNRLASQVICNKEVPVKTVHNGIDIKRFVDAKPKERSVLGLNNDDYVVFYSGRLTKEKGVLQLIRAIKMIKDIKNLKLIIAGASFYGTDSQQSPFITELKKETEEIKDKVVFTGFVDYTEIPSYLKMANVAVVPSLWEEPFGLTVLEAMAAGIPLIATRCGGIPEICEHEAILIDREEVCDNIRKSILHLYHSPQEAEVMREKALKRSWAFDKASFAKDYLEVIQTTLHLCP